MIKLPAKDEINVCNSLDEIRACKHFYNKTLPEAEALFRENSFHYQDDLLWMGLKALSFYLEAVLDYLKSDYSAEDDSLISFLYGTFQLRSKRKDFSLALDSALRVIDYVINNYEKFAVDKKIYGDLLGKYKQLQSDLKGMTVK